ncbi:bHLH domain containing transcription factor E12/E47 [Oopsacas minuta]|uniref:BHLH domain containing transcription factor E12/E47 n=1 Tax=Oopsacas minuta TaxID=111878 RepID=A0AAV7K0P2_9METZ|nr:bHLH domain containing transcription factor E12/E47 [Oopsacas minuta]
MINSVQSNAKIPAQGSQSTAGIDSPVFDVNQFLYNNDPLFDTSFDGILNSSPVPPENGTEIESGAFRPISPPISKAQYSFIDRSEKRQHSQLKPVKAQCTFSPVTPQINTFSPPALNSDSSYEHLSTPYNTMYMTPNANHLCRTHSPEHIMHGLFHSPITQDQLLYPNSEYTCYNQSCPHHVTTHSTPIYLASRCISKYVRLPVDSCECPYSPVVNRRGVPQPNASKVSLTPNQITCVRPPPPVDQFSTPTLSQNNSKRNNFIQNFSPNDLSLPNYTNCTTPAFRNCEFGNMYPETRSADSFTTLSSQGLYDSCVSTQEEISNYQEESILSSQLSSYSQTPVISDISSQLTDQSSLESFLPKTTVINNEEYLNNRKKKENKKRNSERERTRIRQINKAFKDLGDVCCFHMNERAQSKVATIEQALVLIQELQYRIAQKKASESESHTQLS